jgi:hypothetical protein
MSGRAPESFWDRLMRRLDASEDDEREVDESMLSFHLHFIVPILLVLVLLMRR